MMRKIVIWGAGLSLCLLMGCRAQPPYASESVQSGLEATAVSVNQTVERRPDWSVYEAYGLSYNEKTDVLTYNGERVRYFQDSWPLADQALSGVEHIDTAGTVDVHTRRDTTEIPRNSDGSYDPSGVLLSLEADTAEEFAARDMDALLHPSPGETHAVSGEPMTLEENASFYAAYAPYGLTYDQDADRLYFNGEPVAHFLDVMLSNGEDPSGGKFKGTISNRYYENGTVSVQTVRDYGRLDKNGYGTLTGLETFNGNKNALWEETAK